MWSNNRVWSYNCRGCDYCYHGELTRAKGTKEVSVRSYYSFVFCDAPRSDSESVRCTRCEAVVALVTYVSITDDPTGLYSTEYFQSWKASGPE